MTFTTASSDGVKRRNIHDIFFFYWLCGAALYSDQVSLCVYQAACLQTMWLSGCQHHHSLPCIDLPNCSSAFSASSCRIDAFSSDFHAHFARMFCSSECTQTFGKTLSPLQAYIQFSKSYRNLILSLALFVYSSSPSWVVSHCLGQTYQPELTSGSKEKDRKGDIYGAGVGVGWILIDQRVHLLHWFKRVCVCAPVYVCQTYYYFTCIFFSQILGNSATYVSHLMSHALGGMMTQKALAAPRQHRLGC